jgi:hypothetical protein
MSLQGAVSAYPRIRLYVHPLLWTSLHLKLLRVSIRSGCSPHLVGPSHRQGCSDCNKLGLFNEVAASYMHRRTAPGYRDQRIADLIQFAADSLLWEVRGPAYHHDQHE